MLLVYVSYIGEDHVSNMILSFFDLVFSCAILFLQGKAAFFDGLNVYLELFLNFHITGGGGRQDLCAGGCRGLTVCIDRLIKTTMYYYSGANGISIIR